MQHIDNHQIDTLLEDISKIKTVINKNRSVLQQIFHPARFRWFMLAAGLCIIAYSLGIHFVAQHYGGFGQIPNTLKLLIYVAIGAGVVVMQFWKLKRFSFSIQKVDHSLNLTWFFKQFYASHIANLWIPLITLLVVLSVFFVLNDIPYYIVPTIAIGYGLLCNFLGTMLKIQHTLVAGYWFLISGMVVIFLNFIPGLVALALTLGCGILIFAFSGFLSQEEG